MLRICIKRNGLSIVYGLSTSSASNLPFSPSHLDIDECATNRHQCSQVCVNTRGGHRCACNPGYNLARDGRSCYRKNFLYTYLITPEPDLTMNSR